MKGCGFHQSGTAQHWHWALCGWAVEFSVLAVLLLPVCLLLWGCLLLRRPDPLHPSGQWQGQVRQLWVGQGLGEVALLFALGVSGAQGGCRRGRLIACSAQMGSLKPGPPAVGWSRSDGAQASCWLLYVNDVCAEQALATQSVFALLVLPVSQLAYQGLQVTVNFPWGTSLFCARVNVNFMASCQMVVCLPFNGIFLLSRMAAFCLSGEGTNWRECVWGGR